jgi:transposase
MHRHPTLCRMWALIRSQPQVPAHGQNEKTVVYGGVDYATARITYTVAPTKSGANFMTFLIALLQAYPGRKIRLVCDNGRFHHTQAVRVWLKEHRMPIQVYWLPSCSPSLNLIERLWGHLNRTILAKVLNQTLDGLVTAFHRGITSINAHRDLMDLMFKHERSRRKIG